MQPELLATRQAQWERKMLVFKMREAGETFPAIGKAIGGVKPHRVRQLYFHAKELLKRGQVAPIERAENTKDTTNS